MAVVTISESNFETEVLKSSTPVLADFMAAWCNTCRSIYPTLEKWSDDTPEIKVGKVNVDESPSLEPKYEVRSIPTLILFRDGKAVGHLTGKVTCERLEELASS